MPPASHGTFALLINNTAVDVDGPAGQVCRGGTGEEEDDRRVEPGDRLVRPEMGITVSLDDELGGYAR
jgi:hypothetical protein